MKHTIFGVERDLDISGDVFPAKEQVDEMEKDLPECQHGWFDSVVDGAKLHYRSWLPSNGEKIKAVVVYIHGISAHSGQAMVIDGRKLRKSLLADGLTEDGCALYAIDLLGHGYSEGLRFFVPDYKNNRDDCIAFCKLVASKHTDLPLFVGGESYGGCLALHVTRYFQDHPDEKPNTFESAILLCPAIIGDLPPAPVVYTLRYILAPLFPKWIPFFMPNPVSPDRIWKDEKARELATDPRKIEMRLDGSGLPFRLGTAVSLLVALEECRKSVIPGLNMPFCVIHGNEDYAVPIDGTKLLMEKCSTTAENCLFKEQPGAYHDLLADPSAEDTMKVILDWINKRIASSS